MPPAPWLEIPPFRSVETYRPTHASRTVRRALEPPSSPTRRSRRWASDSGAGSGVVGHGRPRQNRPGDLPVFGLGQGVGCAQTPQAANKKHPPRPHYTYTVGVGATM